MRTTDKSGVRLGGWPVIACVAALSYLLLAASPAGAQAAAPQALWKGCATGSAAGQCLFPRGIGVDPNSGHLFVADQTNSRVTEFTAWGQFVRAWGWGVKNGSPEFQICTSASGCLPGIDGSGAGQFNKVPGGIAVDSNGNVYVVDYNNLRVQKFDSEGHFVMMFGGKVDKATNANVCTAASGDECGIGLEGTGNGSFTFAVPAGSYIAAGPGNTIYVGDTERVQEFEANGSFLKSVALPEESVQSLTVDPTGNIYVSYFKDFFGAKVGVHKFSPAGAPLCTSSDIAGVASPVAVTSDATGNLYVADGFKTILNEVVLRKFTAGCAEVKDATFPFSDDYERSTGIATSVVTEAGEVGLYVSNASQTNSFLRAYYPPPDKAAFGNPPAVPPTISSQYVVSASTESALLRAQINPHFWEPPFPSTTYYVEYGTGKCSEGGCTQVRPAAPGSQLGAGIVDEAVTIPGLVLPELTPATTYHYRFVAQSGGGGPVFAPESTFTTFGPPLAPSAPCANSSFRKGPGARLPDCRAYEMVSPVAKDGGDVAVLEGLYLSGFDVHHVLSRIDQSDPAGNTVTYSTNRAFGEVESAPWSSQYMASRDPETGWQSKSINAPRGDLPLNFELAQEIPYKSFSDDLCSGWVFQETDRTLVEGAPEGVPNLYRRRFCGSGYELLTSVAPPGFSKAQVPNIKYFPSIQAWSSDGSHSLVRANAKLTPNASSVPSAQLYESSEGLGGNAQLTLISVLEDGNASKTNSSLGTAAGGLADFHNDSVQGAVSTDGSRVFWTANGTEGPPPAGVQPGTLYLRANPLAPQTASGACDEPAKACTLQISAAGSLFWAADSTGSLVIYQTGSKLYEAEIAEESGELVAKPTLIAEGVAGVMGGSRDATLVYLISSKALASGATEGSPNLYLHTRGGAFKLIGTLAATDSSADFPSIDNIRSGFRLTRVSADGLHAAFMSAAPLTGYDNTDAASGRADNEVFLYDASANGGAGELRCVSCNPSGSRPAGREVNVYDNGNTRIWDAARIPAWMTQQHPSRLLATDGSYLFFESFEALVPADTNGVVDVYEWERSSSKAECQAKGATSYVPSAGGCLSLVSSGESPEDSEVIDASADGRDVFFITDSSLFGEDTGLFDLYDARTGGGFAAKEPRSSCQGEACQPASTPPSDQTPSSSSYEGPGNESPPPPKKTCRKGTHKVKKGGKTRCVKNKKKHQGKRNKGGRG